MKWVIILHVVLNGIGSDATLIRPLYDSEQQCMEAARQVVDLYMDVAEIDSMSFSCVQRKIEQREVWM